MAVENCMAISARRNNTFSFTVLLDGVLFGQCSELCGVLHGFMPIVVKAV